MLHITPDDAFINCAYVSEKWAAHSLETMKERFANRWNDIFERQYQDEVRHTKMLLGVLEKNSPVIYHNTKYSIQERLFVRGARSPHFDLDVLDFDSFLTVQYLMEKRAIWSYKVYMKVGQNETYKKILAQVIEDEKGHFRSEEIRPESNVYKQVKDADHWLFRVYTVKGYAPIPLMNDRYWKFYFEG